MGGFCNNIGLVLAYLPIGAMSPHHHDPAMASLSCLLYFLCMLVIPISPFLCIVLLIGLGHHISHIYEDTAPVRSPHYNKLIK